MTKKLKDEETIETGKEETPQITTKRGCIGFLISDEIEAIDGYDKTLKRADLSEYETQILEKIRNDEIDHIDLLNEIMKTLTTGAIENTNGLAPKDEEIKPADVNEPLADCTEKDCNTKDDLGSFIENVSGKVNSMAHAAEDGNTKVKDRLELPELKDFIAKARSKGVQYVGQEGGKWKFLITEKTTVEDLEDLAKEGSKISNTYYQFPHNRYLFIDDCSKKIKDVSWTSTVAVEGISNGQIEDLKSICAREHADYNKALAAIKNLINKGENPQRAYAKIKNDCSINSVEHKYDSAIKDMHYAETDENGDDWYEFDQGDTLNIEGDELVARNEEGTELNPDNMEDKCKVKDSDIQLLKEYYNEKQPNKKMELATKLKQMGYEEGISGVNTRDIMWVRLNGKRYQVKNLSSVSPLDKESCPSKAKDANYKNYSVGDLVEYAGSYGDIMEGKITKILGQIPGADDGVIEYEVFNPKKSSVYPNGYTGKTNNYRIRNKINSLKDMKYEKFIIIHKHNSNVTVGEDGSWHPAGVSGAKRFESYNEAANHANSMMSNWKDLVDIVSVSDSTKFLKLNDSVYDAALKDGHNVKTVFTYNGLYVEKDLDTGKFYIASDGDRDYNEYSSVEEAKSELIKNYETFKAKLADAEPRDSTIKDASIPELRSKIIKLLNKARQNQRDSTLRDFAEEYKIIINQPDSWFEQNKRKIEEDLTMFSGDLRDNSITDDCSMNDENGLVGKKVKIIGNNSKSGKIGTVASYDNGLYHILFNNGNSAYAKEENIQLLDSAIKDSVKQSKDIVDTAKLSSDEYDKKFSIKVGDRKFIVIAKDSKEAKTKLKNLLGGK